MAKKPKKPDPLIEHFELLALKSQSKDAIALLKEAIAYWKAPVPADEYINGAETVDWLVDFLSKARKVVKGR